MASTSSTASQSQIQYVSQIQNTFAFHGLAPQFSISPASTSATSSSPRQKLPCDVFINHRGPDVKHKLARDIYNALNAMGFRVFLDSEDLQLGDFFPTELQEAISRASLHVAIFSPTYAQSPWCLAELSFMLKSGTPIIPVFYHVAPDDLRHLVHGKGIYETAFVKHQEKARYSENRLREWKMALHTVSFYKGEIIANNDEEQRVLKNIVNRVLKEMKVVPLEVAKHPVGLEGIVSDFEMTACKSAKHLPTVQIVGIWGMGGSGKTTLAKEIYNQRRTSVERSSFVFNVRDAADKRELHKKQIKPLHDLGFKHDSFDSIEEGKRILSNYLRSVRILIILDDVDHTDQLEALLPTKDSLAWGSLIIVTTREKEVLRCWGISSIYEMESMNRSHAKQLFCWHAFLQPMPLQGFEELVEKFLTACNGLPLSLKVFGGQLYCCFNKDLWESVLHKISRILPSDIKNRLKVSYDALDEEVKQMFLDIACFFIDKDKMTAIAVWDGSGWSGLYGWETLVNKYLVSFDNDNNIKMHDHLRDLGREIAKNQTPYRLWSPVQIIGIQKQTEIRGMILDAAINYIHKFPPCLRCFESTRMPSPDGLKVFVVKENSLKSLQIAKLSRELALLSCTEIACKNLPSWLPLKNLRVLELYKCQKMVGLWKDWVEAPLQLRVLIIHDCPNLARIPKAIELLENLKKICLHDCNVQSLPEEFCRLQSLEHLELKSCKMLSSLPSCFGHLTNLRHLNLSSSIQLIMLPESFKQLSHLQHLDLCWCEKLRLQSDILQNMTKLEYLNLDWCMELEELPHHITNQASLRELYLKGTRLRELPLNIGQLTKLRVLEIHSNEWCFQMQSLPDSMGSLNLLERLELESLKVESLPQSLKQLTNLQLLKIIRCPITELKFGREPFASSLCNLKKIFLWNTRVSKISISDSCCPSLRSLRLRHNAHLTEVDTLPTTVEDIQVISCKLLMNINGISDVVNLRELKLSGCPELTALPSFDKLASLEVFKLTGGNKVEKIQGLQECTSLKKLHCTCWEVPGIENLGQLGRLRRLQLIAKKRSAVETCIQTIQNLPEEIIICTKAVPGAGSILNSSAFPNLCVIDSFANEKFGYYHFFPSLRLRENCSSNGNAMMLCLVINCVSPRMPLYIDRHCNDRINRCCKTEVEEGKWILIGVFTQHSRCLTAQNFYIREGISAYYEGDNDMEKGMFVRGDKDSVVEAFHRLFTLLGS
ncbi:hypothetical protein SUGI_0713810 [Cryptomeria japonica]|uniref:disease resistance protein RPV1-like n=1 Tax=Cryptomeria japonica TaxID=3369 RepID=UPI002414A9BA|nr:disease resistance protein RPV1-like [Cryptomeria japonica]GLJ35499.1 hypothetical protein SUGI_0713810 [Cryptomeria japonica]